MTNKLLAMMLLTACGAQVDSTNAPDAGLLLPGSIGGTGSGSGSGSGSAGSPTISLAGSHVLDERGDRVDFSSGEPVHTHLGPSIDLSHGCPDVFLYAYLRDHGGPQFGGEATANPLAWQVSAQSSLPIATEEYRVAIDNGAQLVDWTPITGGTVALYRDQIHALATFEGQLNVDIRVRDTHGDESIASACVTYHPMAAPLELPPIVHSSEGEPLFPMTLAADAPISSLIASTGAGPDVISQRFVHHTAEPISLALTLTKPSGTYARVVADRFVKIGGGASLDCGNDNTYHDGDDRCSRTTHVTSGPNRTFGGGIASGTWSIAVVDEATHVTASVCTVNNLQATCTIPSRAAGAAPHGYRIVARLTNVTDLAPASGTIGEYSVTSCVYTGTPTVTVSHCDAQTQDTSGEYHCAYSTYAHFIALDQAQLALQPATIAYRSSIGAALPLAPLPYAPQPFSSGILQWDSGIDVLPGEVVFGG